MAYNKNTAGQFCYFQGVDATTGGIKSGVTWTIRRSIDGTFAAGGGSVTEDGTTGWYKYAMSQADTNGTDLGFNFTGTGAVPQTVNCTTDGGSPNVNVASINAVSTSPVTTIKAVQGLTTADTIATYTGNTPQTGDSFARIGANGAGLTAVVAASVTGAVGSVTGNVGGTTADFTTQLTESYRAFGAAPTPAQALFEVIGHLTNSAISGTTKTVKKLDRATTAKTGTLDSAVTPASIVEAS